jgi:hypothetical protein
MEGNGLVTIKTKAPTFEPFGEELNAESALWQAAKALDAAVYLAVQSGNVEKLLDASAMWIGLGERLAQGFEEEDDLPADNPNKPQFGFCNTETPEPIEPGIVEVETTDEEETEDAGS